MSEEENAVELAESKAHAKEFVGTMLTLPIVVALLAAGGAWQGNQMTLVGIYGGLAAVFLVMLIMSYAKDIIAPFWLALLMLASVVHCVYDLRMNEVGNRLSMILMGAYAVAALPASVLAWLNYVSKKVGNGEEVKSVWNVPIAILILFIAVIAGGYKYLQLGH